MARESGGSRSIGPDPASRPSPVSRSSTSQVLATCLLVAAVGVVLAIRDQRFVLYDDAAITLRYAVRIASGEGFTYNAGDRTNGASAPLYTLVLALGDAVFRDAEAVARAIGVVCYSATAALVTAVLCRGRGVVAGAIGGLVLLSSTAFRTEALSGMESGFAAALGMLVIYLVVVQRMTWAGVVLGLAITTKLDAALLAIAVGAASWVVLQRPPWRLAAMAAVSATPWVVFSLMYFGSVLPHSALQKLRGTVANPSSQHDPLWILRHIVGDRAGILLCAGLLLGLLVVGRYVRLSPPAALAALSCSLWVLLHGAAFSLIDLGDPYPWYRAVLFPAIVVSGLLAFFVVGDRISAAGTQNTAARPSRTLEYGRRAVLVGLLVFPLVPNVATATRTLRHGHDVTSYEKFEHARVRAGEFVGNQAGPTEVVRSCFGWIAYGALDNPIDESCPLNTRIDLGQPTWIVTAQLHEDSVDRPPPRYMLVRSFRSPAGSSFVYRLPSG